EPKMTKKLYEMEVKIGRIILTGTLHLMEDITDDGKFESVKDVVDHVRPGILLVNARCDASVLELVRGTDAYSLHIRPSTDFMYKTSRNRLLSVCAGRVSDLNEAAKHVAVEMEGAESNDRGLMMHFLESFISLENLEMVGCAGALLLFLQREAMRDRFAQFDEKTEILSVSPFNLPNVMKLNEDAVRSLSIFHAEAHPNMRSKESKEGLSLFAIMNQANSIPGKALLRTWFLRPSTDLELLRSRHTAIAFLLRPGNLAAITTLQGYLKNIKNVPKICQKFKSRLNALDWETLLKFTFYSLKIKATVEAFQAVENSPFPSIMSLFNASDLKDIGVLINSVMDFDASKDENRCVVKPGVDDSLDDQRRIYQGLDNLLSHAANEVSKSLPQALSKSLNVVYFPQLGYLITIPLRPEMRNQEDFVFDGLKFQFCTEKTVFYKSSHMYEMDEAIGDIHSLIMDREIEIFQRLQESVAALKVSIIDACRGCAEIDCLLSLADAARLYGFTRPTMVEDSRLMISGGWHPLTEQCTETFVRNSTMLGCGGGSEFSGTSGSVNGDGFGSLAGSVNGDFIGDDFMVLKDVSVGGGSEKGKGGGNRKGRRRPVSNQGDNARFVLLTGPNASGKSVYLKQIGLIVFLAHVGSFVPAQEAIIGLTDRILTRVLTLETEIKMSLAIRNATKRSLVLIDEFGKGTSVCELFQLDLLKQFQGGVLAECTMDFLVVDDDGGEKDGTEAVTFLYRVVPGRAKSSLGIYCASRAGVPAHVVERGRLIADAISNGLPYPNFESPGSKMQRERVNKEIAGLLKGFDCEDGDLETLFARVGELAEVRDGSVRGGTGSGGGGGGTGRGGGSVGGNDEDEGGSLRGKMKEKGKGKERLDVGQGSGSGSNDEEGSR
ncbi:MutS protein msh5, partial [Blyttiomyces sp. JEL0837]